MADVSNPTARLSQMLSPALPARSVDHAVTEAASLRAPVWVLASPRAGERTQLMALAEGLGAPFVVKTVVHRPLGVVPGILGVESPAGIDREQSDPLTGPWPDLVLLAHHRNEAVARWIRRMSGGRTRLVLIGRSWLPAKLFDLVVTTPQYGLPARPNVLHNALPLHPVSAERLAGAAQAWRPRLAHLPGPFVTVLVGGSSGPYRFDAAAATRLGREASVLARQLGGSVLVTTSARTPATATEALFHAIDAPAYLHRWAPGGTDNPYFGFVGLADRLVVTGDSISMIAEACATGKPVHLFDFGAGGALAMREGAASAAGSPLGRAAAWLYARFLELPRGRLNRARDLRVVHRTLLAAGRVSWLGEPPALAPLPSAGNELTRTVNRVRDLLRDRGNRHAAPVHVLDGYAGLPGAAGELSAAG